MDPDDYAEPGWTASLSKPEDGQCDNCGKDLFEHATDLYVQNATGDAFCYECYSSPLPEEV